MTKHLPLLAALLLIAHMSLAQTSYLYTLRGSLAETTGHGPALVPLDSGTFRPDTLPCTGEIRSVYHFNKGSGLSFDNGAAGNYMRQSYTLELYFRMEHLGRYSRVIDFKNRTTDYGCYIYYGALNFYNLATSDTVPFADNRYQYYVITRDSASQVVRIYSSGTSRLSFIDTDTNATLNTANVLHFFQDDFVVPNETSAGNVARIEIRNVALDSATIHSRFTNLCSLLSVEQAAPDLRLTLAPNPAGETVDLRLSDFSGAAWQYQVYGMDGRLCLEGQGAGAVTPLSLLGLPPGLYNIMVATPGRQLRARLMRL